LLQRGANEKEIVECVSQSCKMPVERGRFSAKKTFLFESVSPINNQYYQFKIIEPIFIEEEKEIVVVTVKVFYSNEEKDL